MTPLFNLLRRKLDYASHFDVQFYLTAYDDVRRAGVDPLIHYLKHGWREGRNPSPTFHTLYYKDKHLNGSARTNPLTHYVRVGRTARHSIWPESTDEFLQIQKKVIISFFDENFYRMKYASQLRDLAPMEHYLRQGWRLGCEPAASFSSSRYLQIHSHVALLQIPPFYHYVSTLAPLSPTNPKTTSNGSFSLQYVGAGSNEPASELVEIASPEFDSTYYLRSNQDVRSALADPLTHYLTNGWREGRNPSSNFWTSYYLSQNDDVRASGVNPFYHYLKYGRSEGRQPNPIGSNLWELPGIPPIRSWRALPSGKDRLNAAVVVIIPVYKGYEATLACLHSVLTSKNDAEFTLLVINDCSPDEHLATSLGELADMSLFSYIENDENLGFVETVNKGMSLYADKDVILLNSDTLVHGDWIDRLLRHAETDETVATITPWSNNGTICSYPNANDDNVLELEVSTSLLDEYAVAANQGRSTIIPTGVGFCLYVRRTILDRIGPFDAVSFGRGYGEENDYCLRALKTGYKNLFAHDVFVYHKGETSFAGVSSETISRQKMVLNKKHPDYDLRVQRYIKADPARECRLRLDLYRLAKISGPKSALLVSHSLGGGVALHLRHLTYRLANEGYTVLLMTASQERADCLQIKVADGEDIYIPTATEISALKYRETISDFLCWLSPKIVHVHSFVGFSWPATVALMDIIKQSPFGYAYTAHDFSSICHRNHLVTSEGHYCGQPSIEICRSCIKSDPDAAAYVEPAERRRRYEEFLSEASRLIAPSADTAARLKKAFPDVSFTVRPHEEFLPATRRIAPARNSAPVKIAILGAIGVNKGSATIHDLALDAKLRRLAIEFTIIGHSDLEKTLLDEVKIFQTGAYSDASEAFTRLLTLRPHLIFFPAIAPETYCYTLSIALAVGAHPVAFDIGAQAERLRALGVGTILDRELIQDPGALNDAVIGIARRKQTKSAPVRFAVYENIIQSYYGAEAASDFGDHRAELDAIRLKINRKAQIDRRLSGRAFGRAEEMS